jgi:hypothetical protein
MLETTKLSMAIVAALLNRSIRRKCITLRGGAAAAAALWIAGVAARRDPSAVPGGRINPVTNPNGLLSSW